MATSSDLHTFAASISFSFCSVGMLYYNKVAISVFPLQCTLVAGQMSFAVLVALVFGWPWLRIGSARDALRWMLVMPTFTGMLLTSVLALKYSPMSCIVVFRGLSPLGTLLLEQFYPQPVKITPRMWQSIIVMVVGSALYVVHMPAQDMMGMCWALLNSFIAVVDRLVQRYLLSQDKVDISKIGLTLLSNLYSLPVVLGIAFALGEFPQVHDYAPLLRFYDKYCILVSCFIGLGLSFCGIWAQSLMTATSFLVMINACKFVIIGIDVLSGQRTLSKLQISAIFATIIAACVYGYARQKADELEAQEVSLSETQALLEKTYRVQGPGHKMV